VFVTTQHAVLTPLFLIFFSSAQGGDLPSPGTTPKKDKEGAGIVYGARAAVEHLKNIRAGTTYFLGLSSLCL